MQKEIWLTIEDVCSLTNEIKETVRRKCKSGKYQSTSRVTPDSEYIYPKLSAFCGGNTRVLTKLLVRASRIAKLNNTTIDEDVLNSALTQLLWVVE